jgi:hypothetical protein
VTETLTISSAYSANVRLLAQSLSPISHPSPPTLPNALSLPLQPITMKLRRTTKITQATLDRYPMQLLNESDHTLEMHAAASVAQHYGLRQTLIRS